MRAFTVDSRCGRRRRALTEHGLLLRAFIRAQDPGLPRDGVCLVARAHESQCRPRDFWPGFRLGPARRDMVEPSSGPRMLRTSITTPSGASLASFLPPSVALDD